MGKTNRSVLFVGLFMFTAVICSAFAGDYTPWDVLTEDSWIMDIGDGDPLMYPVNAADCDDIVDSYPVAFQYASFSEKTGLHKGRGMNALKFIHGGSAVGHHVSKDKAGSFIITNTGETNYFTDILLLVAIDAKQLDGDFSMTLNLTGQLPYFLGSEDFVYYDGQHGRPSGFHSATDPSTEPVSYAFDAAMVTVFGVSGLDELEPTLPTDPNTLNTMTVEYSFDDVPAPVVFSAYGYASSDPGPTIYHTNRAFIDQNIPQDEKNVLSTFAVTVDGDLNGDLKVNLADLAILSRNWFIGVR